LNAVYPVNSGTEAIEAAMKLVKRVTGRSEIIAFKGAYHGSTQGSMSISSNEVKKTNFRPLLPGIRFINLNRFDELDCITENTAGVFLETIQGDAGIRIPEVAYIQALRKRCDEVGAMLVLDEIQCGLGRTGKLFAFEHFGIVPDVLTLGKALGGGMPIGALVTRQEWMQAFTHDPMLGHITTFGGHPVCAAAGLAANRWIFNHVGELEIEKKSQFFKSKLVHPLIQEVTGRGLLLACHLNPTIQIIEFNQKLLQKGIFTDWFLFNMNAIRIAPPLIISLEEIEIICNLILQTLDEYCD
jgi:acetylornithine/succinyldiaminopimelate/putrescine aminotransferase